MAKWAIHDEAGHVTDICNVDPKTILHPDLAKHYVSVANSVAVGQIKGSDGKYTTPAPVPEVPIPASKNIFKAEFFGLLTAAERKALKGAAATDDTVEDFLDMFNYGPHNLADTDVKADIDYFVTKSFIGSTSKGKLDSWSK